MLSSIHMSVSVIIQRCQHLLSQQVHANYILHCSSIVYGQNTDLRESVFTHVINPVHENL